MTSYIWLNEQLLPLEGISLSYQDRGFLLGDGFFTTIRCENGIPICLAGHYQRLQRSASFFRIPFSYSFEKLQEAIAHLLQKNGYLEQKPSILSSCHPEFVSASQQNQILNKVQDNTIVNQKLSISSRFSNDNDSDDEASSTQIENRSGAYLTYVSTGSADLRQKSSISGIVAVRITITRGIGPRGLKPDFSASPTLTLQAVPYEPPLTPVKTMISSLKRDELSPLNQHKHLGYQLSILALQEALDHGYDEAIILNNRGNVVCTTTGNIFMSIDGKLYTPPLRDGCLPGIERARLLQHYKRTQQSYEICSLSPSDLEKADQIFYTNSLVQKREIKL